MTAGDGDRLRKVRLTAPDLPMPTPGRGFTQAVLRVPFVASGFLIAHDNVERAGTPICSGAFPVRTRRPI